MSGSPEDRGLDAVARVREVRARDSRLGLQRAIGEQLELQQRLEGLEQTLREQQRPVSDAPLDLNTFAARRATVLAQAAIVRRARMDAAAAQMVRDLAAQHWSADQTRLSAVETLLELRAEQRRVDAGRASAKELDETGARLWLRRSQRDPGAAR